MPDEFLEFGPPDTGPNGAILSLSEGEAKLLTPDHPFLEFGEWRGFAVLSGGTVVARVVASVDPRQSTTRGAVGCIGFVRLGPDTGHSAPARAATKRALAAAVAWLGDRHVHVIRSPVQFSTWYGHRAIVDGFPDQGGAPSFPMEPRNGPALVDVLQASGFAPAHRAVSVAVRSELVISSGGPILERLRRAGWHDRPLRPRRVEEELRLLHRLSGDIFRDSWGFSEISPKEFSALYRPTARRADAALVRFAMDSEAHLLGFAFALPRGPGPTWASGIVVKTLGLLPDALLRYAGAGPGLTALVHVWAREHGCTDGIHALMATGSMAHRMSLHWGTPLRSYATFERVPR
jgi:hypothetical protein